MPRMGSLNAPIPVVSRRGFLHAATVATIGASVSRPVLAAPHDLLIRGGRVIDPSRGYDRIADVAVSSGRIAAVGVNVAPDGAKEIIEAQGKLVVPGLIDVHTHARTPDMPGIVLSQGVTSIVDAGSQGADKIDEVVAIAKAAPNRVRILLNLSKVGLSTGTELMDIANADVDAARRAIERHRDVVVGVKARLSDTVVGKNDLEAVRRARAAVEPFGLPVMLHVGQTVSPLPAILALLKPGDIVTHIYAPPPNSIFDARGNVLSGVLAARKRGIWYDIGNGRVGHITWQMAEDAIKKNFLPDTISSDWTDAGRALHVVDFPNVLSKFLLLGVPLDRVLAMATSNAARLFPAFKGLGTLAVGAPADVTVLEIRDGRFEFVDNAETRRTGTQRLVTAATLFAGKRA
jgi:dihydroorotase